MTDNVLLKFLRGMSTRLPENNANSDGSIYICLDTSAMWTDYNDDKGNSIRIPLNIFCYDYIGGGDASDEWVVQGEGILGKSALGSFVLGAEAADKYIKLDGSCKLDGTFKLK